MVIRVRRTASFFITCASHMQWMWWETRGKNRPFLFPTSTSRSFQLRVLSNGMLLFFQTGSFCFLYSCFFCSVYSVFVLLCISPFYISPPLLVLFPSITASHCGCWLIPRCAAGDQSTFLYGPPTMHQGATAGVRDTCLCHTRCTTPLHTPTDAHAPPEPRLRPWLRFIFHLLVLSLVRVRLFPPHLFSNLPLLQKSKFY